MKIIFSKIQYKGIFEEEFKNLNDENGTIEFKQNRENNKGGIAVVYAPNGTGKSSLSNLIKNEQLTEGDVYLAKDDQNKLFSSHSDCEEDKNRFLVIDNQGKRNIIKGQATDYLIGPNIRREYELSQKVETEFNSIIEALIGVYKSKYKISKQSHCIFGLTESGVGDYIKQSFPFIQLIVNTRDKGKSIDKSDLFNYVKTYKDKAIDNHRVMEDQKVHFIVEDLSGKNITDEVIKINLEMDPNSKVNLVEQHDDAIQILEKYKDLDECIVCDGHIKDTEKLLESKKKKRKNIYDELSSDIKTILKGILNEDFLNTEDPFEIKKIVGDFISDGEPARLIALQKELREYKNYLRGMISRELLDRIDNNLINTYEELIGLQNAKPEIDTEELLLIEEVIKENIEKELSITRDPIKKNHIINLGNQILASDNSEGTKTESLELSTGEQNFISLAFELLYARNSNKEYILIDDPISSFDSIYKNKIAYCIIKFLEGKKQIILTHNTDLIRLLHFQRDNCFNLYLLNNTSGGRNGFTRVSTEEQKLLLNLHNLLKVFCEDKMKSEIIDFKLFLMSMIPFMRGYAHIIPEKNLKSSIYDRLSKIMHGYNKGSLNVSKIYRKLFPLGDCDEFIPDIKISVDDVLNLNCNDLNIIKKDKYPLLADTLEQTLIYYHLRMKVERKLVEIFDIKTSNITMLTNIIMQAFKCNKDDSFSDEKRKWRVFFTSRKTLLNEFNHFEGNLSIFQPAIDITRLALTNEVEKIETKLDEIEKTYNIGK